MMLPLNGERSLPILFPKLVQNIVNILFPEDVAYTCIPVEHMDSDELPIVEEVL